MGNFAYKHVIMELTV